MTRRVGPTLEGSLAEWQEGETTLRELVGEKVRRFCWATIPPLSVATMITGTIGWAKYRLEQTISSEELATIMTRVAMLGVPGLSVTVGVLLMYGMHLAETMPPMFLEEVAPLGPRRSPGDLESWEHWLYRGVRVGRWQSLDGSGRAGAIARIPIMDEHVFVAARTRWGKSTVEWAILEDLEEAIKQGVVRVILFDPKNGMEMAAAVNLKYVAQSDFYFGEDVGEVDPHTGKWEGQLYEETFVKPLEDLVREMRRRADRIRFKDRRHHAKPGDPHIIVMVDELAQLVRETTPTPVKNRITNAILTLCHQGAACGITVIGCTQHPSIEEIGPIRHGLTFGLCGKVKSAKAVDMVLGEGSRRLGSRADKLDREITGVWYTSESGPMALRAQHSGPEFGEDEPPPADRRPPPSERDEEAADRLWERMRSRRAADRMAA